MNTKNILPLFLIVMSTLFISSCVEHRYYHEHHRHSPEYYHRHNMPEPRVDVDIHN